MSVKPEKAKKNILRKKIPPKKKPPFLRSLEMYKLVVENMLDNVTVIAADGTTLYENPSVERMMGYKPEELIGKNALKLIHPDDLEKVNIIFAKVLASEGKEQTVEYRYKHKDGSYRWLQSDGRLYMPAGRKEPVLIVNTRDITQRRKEEEKIKRKDELYKIIMKNFPNGTVTLYDTDLRYIMIEGQELARVSVTSDMLIGRTIYDIAPKDKADILASYLKPCFDGEEHNYEIWNGDRCYKLTTLPIKDESGKIKYALAITQNITEMQNTMKELENTSNKLKKTQRDLINAEKLSMMGRFSSHIAHEVRNPLANISASAQFLMRNLKKDAAANKYLDVILRNAEIANQKIKEMLDYVSPREIELAKGYVSKVLENVIKLTSARCAANNVKVEYERVQDEKAVELNEKKLQEAILNFFVNAIDAMPDGGKLIIKQGLDKKKNLQIQISDTGEGISKENLDKIFEPFFTTKITGTGLGMSIARRTILSHKGSLKIKSKKGHGTDIFVSIPSL